MESTSCGRAFWSGPETLCANAACEWCLGNVTLMSCPEAGDQGASSIEYDYNSSISKMQHRLSWMELCRSTCCLSMQVRTGRTNAGSNLIMSKFPSYLCTVHTSTSRRRSCHTPPFGTQSSASVGQRSTVTRHRNAVPCFAICPALLAKFLVFP